MLIRPRIVKLVFVGITLINPGFAKDTKAPRGKQGKPKGTKGTKSSPLDDCVEQFKAVLEEASGRSVFVDEDGSIGGVFTNTTESTSFEAPQDCFCEVKVLSTGGGAGGGRIGGGGGAGAVNECTFDEQDAKNGGTFVITVGKAGEGGAGSCGGKPYTCPSGGDGGSTLLTGPNGTTCEAAGGGGGGGANSDGTAGVNSTSTGGKGGHGGGGGATGSGTRDGGAGGEPGGNAGGKGAREAGGGGAGADDNGSDGTFDGNTFDRFGGDGGNGTAVPEALLKVLQEVLDSDVPLWRNQTKVAAGGGGYGFTKGGTGGDGGGGNGAPFDGQCTDANRPYTGSGGGGGYFEGCDGASGSITLLFIPCE